jgi:hypothetical protein
MASQSEAERCRRAITILVKAEDQAVGKLLEAGE